MRSAFCSAPREISIREVPKPVIAQGEALVRVSACGICGSDLHWYCGDGAPPQICPGHEVVGRVAEIRGDSRLREGDRVAVEPLRACRTCARCVAGNYHQCSRLSILGVQEDGGLADFMRAPVEALFPVPSGVADTDAVLCEPLAVVVHAIRLAAIQPGQRVAILGAGSIGILAVAAARALGAGEIWVSARYTHQGEAAAGAGADRVFSADEDGMRALMEASRISEIDIVLETVGGHATTLRSAIDVVAPGGTVVVVGIFHNDPVFPALAVVLKEVRVVGSIVYNRSDDRADFDWALDILSSQGGLLSGLVTHRFDLDRVKDAFDSAADKTRGVLKAIVEAV